MNPVERIRELCKDRKISIRALEVACGFSNGYISKIKDDKIPMYRILKIANYLGTTPEYLMTGERQEYYQNDATAEMAQAFLDNPELKLLFDVAKDSTPEDINTVYQVLLALKRKERQ